MLSIFEISTNIFYLCLRLHVVDWFLLLLSLSTHSHTLRKTRVGSYSPRCCGALLSTRPQPHFSGDFFRPRWNAIRARLAETTARVDFSHTHIHKHTHLYTHHRSAHSARSRALVLFYSFLLYLSRSHFAHCTTLSIHVIFIYFSYIMTQMQEESTLNPVDIYICILIMKSESERARRRGRPCWHSQADCYMYGLTLVSAAVGCFAAGKVAHWLIDELAARARGARERAIDAAYPCFSFSLSLHS